MRHRLIFILPLYLLMYTGCFYSAFLLRYDFNLPPEVVPMFQHTLAFLLAVKCLCCIATGEWQRSLRYATLSDVMYVGLGATISTALIYFSNHVNFIEPIPRSIILIDWALTIPAAGALRIASRVYSEIFRDFFEKSHKRRTLVYGIDREAIDILRTVHAGDASYQVVGLIEDGPVRGKALIGGVPVISNSMGWKKIASKLRARHVLIPSSVSGKKVRELVELGREAHFQVHVFPGIHEIVDGRYKRTVRDVTISDLLRRQPAQLDMKSIRDYVAGKRVMVTGGAGSIGSELCRQILSLKPESLVLVDQSELGVFLMEQELKGKIDPAISIQFLIADVTDRTSLSHVFEEQQPQLVFHAAAYKHVPLMEENPREAIRNNVLGTKNVIDLAEQSDVERFVLISTDKAVRPTSVMGATKLIAEKYVQAMASRSRIKCITVRFGNVLNSAGSVVPTFRRQIEEGGPLTVTHPEIERFFMTIPEAVQLVLQAGAVGASGDVLILEMGEPCRIVDLAKDMIDLSGLKYPDDIDITFTGLRPGEKLYEELFYDSEECTNKVHDKIFCGSRQTPSTQQIKQEISELSDVLNGSNTEALAVLWKIVQSHVKANESVTQPLKKAA